MRSARLTRLVDVTGPIDVAGKMSELHASTALCGSPAHWLLRIESVEPPPKFYNVDVTS